MGYRPTELVDVLGGPCRSPEEFRCLGYRPTELPSFAAQWPWRRELEGMFCTTENGGAIHSNECEPATTSALRTRQKCSALKYHPGLQKVVAKAADPAAAAISHENDEYVSLATMGFRRDNQRADKKTTWLMAQNALRKVRTTGLCA